jgi:tRNA C32,U32 (ribose-2'-O)-methylase TrmJ
MSPYVTLETISDTVCDVDTKANHIVEALKHMLANQAGTYAMLRDVLTAVTVEEPEDSEFMGTFKAMLVETRKQTEEMTALRAELRDLPAAMEQAIASGLRRFEEMER